jgi:hypothetical protein
MTERAFVIMQVGAKGSPERKRADEIFNFIVMPAVKGVGLEPYRADLDFTPGPITPKFISELLGARLVIADLTGQNPNVFYELGIAHSFARPLISIADSSKSLPFDTKDERVIELGEYSPSGLTYAQGEQAKADLQESLKIVLSDDYVPPSPLRDVAASASIDRLAPENPIAAEIAQIRETLEELRKSISESRPVLLMMPQSDSGSYWKQPLPTTAGVYFTPQEIDSLLVSASNPDRDADSRRLLILQAISRSERLKEKKRPSGKDQPSSADESS